MPGRVVADLNTADVARARLQLSGIPRGADKALVGALNTSARQGRKELVAEAANDVALKVNFLRKHILGPDQKTFNKAFDSRLEAKISARSSGLRLSHFARSTRTNLQNVGGRLRALVEVKVKKGSGYIAMPSAFYVRLRRGTQAGTEYGIFKRVNGGIKHLYGPSPSQILNREFGPYQRPLSEYFRAEFRSRINALLAKQRAL